MRVIAHMVVGPGEAQRYLAQVIERLTWWADDIHVALDANAGEEEFSVASSITPHARFMSLAWEDGEGAFRQAAWSDMEDVMKPSTQDYIFCIDADEMIVQHDLIKDAVREFAGQRLGFLFHEMWGQRHYRIDGNWKPYIAHVLFPYRPNGRIRERALASGREPTYVNAISLKGIPLADLLHYGYAREEDRRFKYDRYMRLDGGKYHSASHIDSILYTPSLAEWTGGDGLDVRPQ